MFGRIKRDRKIVWYFMGWIGVESGVESFCFLESVEFVGGRKKLIIFDFDASNNYSPRNNNKNVFSFYKIEKE